MVRLGWDSSVFWLIGSLVGLAAWSGKQRTEHEDGIWALTTKLYTHIDGIDLEQDRESNLIQSRVQVLFYAYRMVRHGGDRKSVV